MTYQNEQRPSALDVVLRLREVLGQLSFPFPSSNAHEGQQRCEALSAQLDDALIPRLKDASAPAVVLVTGSTGSGKSTIVNSLVGSEITPSGVLRPTTRKPVLVIHPADLDLMKQHPLVQLADVMKNVAVPRGMALLDAPDFDSVDKDNRELATRLLRAADLCLFVMSALRYGDALPWEYLEEASLRELNLAIVLNRVPGEHFSAIQRDLLERMSARELSRAPLFTIPDAGETTSLLPDGLISELRDWLDMLTGPDHSRGVVARALAGALEALEVDVSQIRESYDRQTRDVESLRLASDGAMPDIAALAAEEGDAQIVRISAALRVWNEATGNGGALEKLAQGRLKGGERRRRKRIPILAQLRSSVELLAGTIIEQAGQEARERVREVWSSDGVPQGSAELADMALADKSAIPESSDSSELAAKWRKGVRDHLARTAEQGIGPGLVDALGAEGLVTLVCSAAMRIGPAHQMLANLAGPQGQEWRQKAEQELRDQAMTSALAQIRPFTMVLQQVATAPRAADDLPKIMSTLEELTS